MTFFDLFRSFYESWRFNPNRKHDERLGQRLYNEIISTFPDDGDIFVQSDDPVYWEVKIKNDKAKIADKLWNMPDKDFIAYLERFFE
jgi:hypothetical protein